MKKIIAAFVLLLFSEMSICQPSYTNPILAGFYPDPSICRVGNDYYIVNSTFAYYPGLPVFHSTDLVNWKQIGNAINRPEQLDYKNAGVSRGLFAPTIRYSKGTYYITCTLIDKGGNFVITAKNPKGPWSNPSRLSQVNGIDPSLFFDDNDSAYFVCNSVAPNNKPLYEGHRTIRIQGFDAASLKVRGDEKIIVNGGTDISKKPVWIEAPHIFKKEGTYYLICAEGGTAYNHSEVVFSSKNVYGPYVSFDKNPILTQRNLDPKRSHPITSTGHADFVETPNHKWYAVFLGCRPYEDDYYNTGRETFMAPMEWKDGWPVINPNHKEVQYHYPVPFPAPTKTVSNKFNSNSFYKDDFNKANLDLSWKFLRVPEKKWYSLSEKKGSLTMQLLPQTCAGKDSPAFLGYRQQHLAGYASTSFNFSSGSEYEKAGMLIFQNENHFYFLCKSLENKIPVIQLYKSNADTGGNMIFLQSQKIPSNISNEVSLKIEANGNTYSFYYLLHGKWTLLKDKVDGKFLSTKVAGGFVGNMYALYATSSGAESDNKASFNWFECKRL
jgi:alpha-N-arabinofuranosidase